MVPSIDRVKEGDVGFQMVFVEHESMVVVTEATFEKVLAHVVLTIRILLP